MATSGTPSKQTGTPIKVELCYTGDYPGSPCIRIGDKWATDAQVRTLQMLFGANGSRELFDKMGAVRIPGSEEHKRWKGTVYITAQADESDDDKTLVQKT